MENSKLKVQKNDLLRFLDGYRSANELIKKERKARLRQLNNEQSLREYDIVCNIWEANPKKEGIKMLEKKRISFLLERREALNQVGNLRGNIGE